MVGELTIGWPGGDERMPASEQWIDEHHHHLLWSAGGTLTVVVGDQSFLARPPSVIWVPAGRPYAVGSFTEVGIARLVAQTCPTGWDAAGHVVVDPVVVPMLTFVAEGPERPGAIELLDVALDQLHAAMLGRARSLPLPVDAGARRIAQAIVRDPGDDRELAAWAGEVAASERTLRRRFLEETGMPYSEWRTKVRMELAVSLLDVGHNVEATARRCGYRSRASFARAFKAHTGLTPTEFADRADPEPKDRPLPRRGRPLARRSNCEPLDEALLSALREGDLEMISSRLGRTVATAAALLLAAVGCSDDDADTATTEAPTTTAAVSTTVAEALEGQGAGDDTTASDEAAGSTETREIIDLAGRTVEIPVSPQRVLAVGPNRIGVALVSNGVQPAGWTGIEEDRAVLGSLAADGVDIDAMELFGLFGEPNLEAIAAADVDLIIAPRDGVVELYEGVAPVVVANMDTTDSLEVERFVAELVGTEDRYDARVAAFEEQVQGVRDRLGDQIEGLTYTYIEYFGPEAVYAYDVDGTEDWFASIRAFDAIGLTASPSQDVADDEGFVQISAEQLAEFDADLVFIGVGADAEVTPQAEAVLNTTEAAANGQLFFVPAAQWGYPPLASIEATLVDLEELLVDRELVDTSN